MSEDKDGINESWTTVTSSDKKRVMRKRGVRRRVNAEFQKGDGMKEITNSDTLFDCLQDSMKYLRDTTLWHNLILSLSSPLDRFDMLGQDISKSERVQRQIVAFGIGNFSRTGTSYYAAPLWQLAIAICLKDHWSSLLPDDSAVRLVFYDPCSTENEISFLERQLGCRVLTNNGQGKHPVHDKQTIFFMPHCPARLYEHVVWSNFETGRATLSFVLVGNSLARLVETTRHSNDEGRQLPCLQALQPWLHETLLCMTAVDGKEAPGNLIGAMNDTFVSYFIQENLNDTWPKRPYELGTSLPYDDPELL